MDQKTVKPPVSLQKIPYDSLQVGELLGHGGYGDVYKAQWHGTEVALKKLHLKTLSATLQEEFLHEAQVMAQCKFPHIISLYGICDEIGHNGLVMEYMPKGSLRSVLEDKSQEISWDIRWEIAIDVGKGLSYLHSNKILHRDLKSLNVLLGIDYHAKICDFGLSKIKLESSSTSIKSKAGTVRWRAPETFNRGYKPISSMDIYSYGMVLWEIASREIPFSDSPDELTVISWIKEGEKETIPAECPKAYGAEIQKCFEKAENRPSANTVLMNLEVAKPLPLAKTKVVSKKIHLEKSWHFDPTTALSAREEALNEGKLYQLLEATEKDKQKAVEYYQHHPVSGYEIGRVQVIYNKTFNTKFNLHLKTLQEKSGNPAFAAKWSLMPNPEFRQQTNLLLEQISKPYTDPDYPAVKLIPAWHGTKPEILDSIFRIGYSNLAFTDVGFFGKGLYSAYEAEYSHRVYSKGALILNWVACFSALPVIDGDMTLLTGQGNYGNYDAHFVPVVPKNPNNPNEVNYFPCEPNQKNQYTEIVVFESSSCLPRYLVELQSTLTKSLSVQPLIQKQVQAEPQIVNQPQSNWNHSGSAAIALYDYDTNQEGYLSFKAGESINILEKTGDWWKGELKGKIGFIPSNYIKINEQKIGNIKKSSKSSDKKSKSNQDKVKRTHKSRTDKAEKFSSTIKKSKSQKVSENPNTLFSSPQKSPPQSPENEETEKKIELTPLPDNFYSENNWLESLLCYYSDKTILAKKHLNKPVHQLVEAMLDIVYIYSKFPEIVYNSLGQVIDPMFTTEEYFHKIYMVLKLAAEKESRPFLLQYADALLILRKLFERDEEFYAKKFPDELKQNHFEKFSATVQIMIIDHCNQIRIFLEERTKYNKNDSADPSYESYRKTQNRSKLYYCKFAEKLYILNRNEKHIEFFNRAISIDENYIPAYVGKAKILIDIEKHEEAIKCYDKAIHLSEKLEEKSSIYNQKGVFLCGLSRYDEARKCFNEAIQLSRHLEGKAIYYSNLGIALSSLDKNEKAIKYYDKAIKLDPKNVLVYKSKAESLSSLGMHNEAIRSYGKAIQLSQSSEEQAELYGKKGDALCDIKKYDEAIKYYDKAIYLSQSSEGKSGYYVNKGMAIFDIGKQNEGIKCLDKAIKLNPKNNIAYNNKAYILIKLNKYGESIKCCDKSIELDKDYANPHKHKGVALIGLQRYEEALINLDKAIKLKENYPDAYVSKGDALNKLGSSDEAMLCYEKAMKLNPKIQIELNDQMQNRPNKKLPAIPLKTAANLSIQTPNTLITKISGNPNTLYQPQKQFPPDYECQHTMDGHSSDVISLAALPNGHVISGSNDGILKVWDVNTGKCLKTFHGVGDSVKSLTALPNGQIICAGTQMLVLDMSNPEGKECVTYLRGHTRNVNSTAVLANGYVISGSDDETLKVWDLKTGQCLNTLYGHRSFVKSLAVLPNGNVISGSIDNTLKVWDVSTGNCLTTLKGHGGTIFCIAVLSNTCLISGSGDKTLKVWNLTKSLGQECVQTLMGHIYSVESIAVLPNGYVISGSTDKTLKIWDLKAGQCLNTLHGHSGFITCVAALKNGNIISGSHDNTLKVWADKNTLEVKDRKEKTLSRTTQNNF